MDKSSRTDVSLDEQRQAWNSWNLRQREKTVGEVSERQAAVILRWCAALGRNDMIILDAGCGAGWMSNRLLPFGTVTGIDLADEVIERARKRFPDVHFSGGDLLEADLPLGEFDLVVSLELLSHVASKSALVQRIARLLKPGGYFMLATQNRWVLERWDGVGGPVPGQIRQWLNGKELRKLLRAEFEVIELTSVLPVGNEGWLRLVNSVKLNRLLAALLSTESIESFKERHLFGHSLLALARRRG